MQIFTKQYFNNSKQEIYNFMVTHEYDIDQVLMRMYDGEEYHIISEYANWYLVRDKNYQFRMASVESGEITKLYRAEDNVLECIDERVVLEFKFHCFK